MRNYPDILTYNTAVRNRFYPPTSERFEPVFSITDPTELYSEPGNRAIVYKVKTHSGQFKALKLFLVHNDRIKSKYIQLSSYLLTLRSSYFVSSQFSEKMIFCKVNTDDNDNYFPGVVMDWAEGKTLGTKVKELIQTNDKTSLDELARRFKDLSLFIISQNFGHGDLKHDNIIVDDNFNLRLIDYDDMFIPGYNEKSSVELGTPSFQHPQRKSSDFNSNVDDFSILTIYTSLLAIAKYPYLYERYQDQQNFLFKEDDFKFPSNSELFQFLSQDHTLSKYTYLIKKSLEREHIYIPDLENIIKGIFPKPSIHVTQQPRRAIVGTEVKLSWETDNVDSVRLRNHKVEERGSQKIIVNLYSKVTFIVSNFFSSLEYEYNFDVVQSPQIMEFVSSKKVLPHKELVFLKWRVEHAQKVEMLINGAYRTLKSVGEQSFQPLKNTSYKLIATAFDDSTCIEQEIFVKVVKPIRINSFISEIGVVLETLPVKFRWDIKNANRVILVSTNGLEIDVSGKKEIEIIPKRTTFYYLKASNDLFSGESNKIEILVQDLPRMPSLASITPGGKDLIPSFSLNLKNLSDEILSESQIEFEKAMDGVEDFSLSKLLKKLLYK